MIYLKHAPIFRSVFSVKKASPPKGEPRVWTKRPAPLFILAQCRNRREPPRATTVIPRPVHTLVVGIRSLLGQYIFSQRHKGDADCHDHSAEWFATAAPPPSPFRGNDSLVKSFAPVWRPPRSAAPFRGSGATRRRGRRSWTSSKVRPCTALHCWRPLSLAKRSTAPPKGEAENYHQHPARFNRFVTQAQRI